MSLVAYGSSDESSDEEVNNEKNATQNKVTNEISNTIDEKTNFSKNHKTHMSLPAPKNERISIESVDKNCTKYEKSADSNFLSFGALPKPRNFQNEFVDIPEDDDIPLFKPKQPVAVTTTKKNRTPARISIPSLSEFKDVDEDLEQSKNKPIASKKATGLFAILPPPKNEIVQKKNNLVPRVLTKSGTNATIKSGSEVAVAKEEKSIVRKIHKKENEKILTVMDYDSNSDEDNNDDKHQDFFSLSKPTSPPDIKVSSNFFTIPEKLQSEVATNETNNTRQTRSKNIEDVTKNDKIATALEVDRSENSTLISTVMNLPRDEILLKNKAEVGPKLPVPEQEFNVDAEGNVAFDEKAIEYLCGKRGVKRKNKMIEEANIIEINGEDIKPDEREWLVKALTEEPVQRPVSMQGAGPSSQSKKKHQITYLAHQAKAMEVELKNTWSQNRMARKQTQSKYGF